MIDISQLRETPTVYCYTPKGDTVTFKAIKREINKVAKAYGVPVAFAFDEIVFETCGNIVVEDCLVVYNPKHANDYYKIVFRIRRDGDIAYISKSEYGISKRMNCAYAFWSDDKDASSVSINGIYDEEFHTEKNYYQALKVIFKFLKC